MTAPSTQVTTLLTQFNLTTAAEELVPRLTQAGHHDALPVLVEVFEAEAEARRQRPRQRRAPHVVSGSEVWNGAQQSQRPRVARHGGRRRHSSSGPARLTITNARIDPWIDYTEEQRRLDAAEHRPD